MADTRLLPQLLLMPGQQTVMQCNDMAVSLGVRLGMNKKTAFCLLSECAIADYNANRESEALQQLALSCYRFAADIQLQPPAGLSLEIGSMLAVYNGLVIYWQQLRQALGRYGFSYQLSTGHTPGVAAVLAQSGHELCTADKQAHQQALQQLSVTQLGFAEKIASQLGRMGVRSYAQLVQLPRREIGFRFGREVVDQLSKLERNDQPARRYVLPPTFRQTIHLNYEAEHAEGLLFPLKHGLLNLESYLFARQLKCEKLLLKLEHRNGSASLCSVFAINGCYRQADWQALLKLKFDRTQLLDPVISITLRAKSFVALTTKNRDFFGDHRVESDVDNMQSLLLAHLGAHQLSKLAISHDPRPEKASGMIDSRVRQTTHNPKKWPTFLLAKPLPINIVEYDIISGPERIEAGWYDQQVSRRDYYVATCQSGAAHWVFRHADGQWFLQGEFL